MPVKIEYIDGKRPEYEDYTVKVKDYEVHIVADPTKPFDEKRDIAGISVTKGAKAEYINLNEAKAELKKLGADISKWNGHSIDSITSKHHPSILEQKRFGRTKSENESYLKTFPGQHDIRTYPYFGKKGLTLFDVYRNIEAGGLGLYTFKIKKPPMPAIEGAESFAREGDWLTAAETLSEFFRMQRAGGQISSIIPKISTTLKQACKKAYEEKMEEAWNRARTPHKSGGEERLVDDIDILLKRAQEFAEAGRIPFDKNRAEIIRGRIKGREI